MSDTSSVDFPDYSGLTQTTSLVEANLTWVVVANTVTQFGPYHCAGLYSMGIKLQPESPPSSWSIDVQHVNPGAVSGFLNPVASYTCNSSTYYIGDAWPIQGGDVYFQVANVGNAAFDIRATLYAGQQPEQQLRVPDPFLINAWVAYSVPPGNTVYDTGVIYPGRVQLTNLTNTVGSYVQLATANGTYGVAYYGAAETVTANQWATYDALVDGGDISITFYNAAGADSDFFGTLLGYND
jgi:hypothetical protein